MDMARESTDEGEIVDNRTAIIDESWKARN
jgi:hypothetical protein